jgi:ABC-type branched-subunit amino acid transport system substrate-binding protein
MLSPSLTTSSRFRLARRLGLATTALCLAAGAATACGTPQSSAGGSGGCTGPGVSPSEVKVGVVAPLTGPAAPTFSGFLEGAQAAFDEQNDAGGVNGRKISVSSDDDKGDGSQQVVAARNAVQSQKVFGIVSASRVDTMYDYLKQQSVPVTGYAGQPAYATDKNAFGFSGASSTGYVSTAVLERMKQTGTSKVAVLAHNSPGAINTAKGFTAAAGQAGLTVAMTQYDIPLGSFDATSVALKIKQSGADSLNAQILTDSSVSVLKALKAQGVTLKTIYVAGVYDPNVYGQIGDLLQGAIISTLGQVPTELNTDATAKYVASMAKYAPTVKPSEGFAAAGYLSAKLFVRGLQEAGSCVSRDNFITKLRAVTDYDANGLLAAKTSFGPAELPDGTPYVKCAWYLTFKGSAWVPDPKPTCGDLIKF